MTSIDIYQAIHATQSKLCLKCNINKSISEFYKRGKNGIQPYCKVCEKAYRQANKERLKEYDKAYRQVNKLKPIIDNDKRLALHSAKEAKRRANKLKATPIWVEVDLIKQLYINCRTLSKSTGIEHHVDHIVPLKSDFVCGLHCIINLRIITAAENLSKSNSYWPDM